MPLWTGPIGPKAVRWICGMIPPDPIFENGDSHEIEMY